MWIKILEMFVTLLSLTYVFSYVNDHEDIFLKPTGSILLENTLNLRPITLQLIPCYTPKMAIVS